MLPKHFLYYKVEEKISFSGMSEIYRVRNLKLGGREEALKLLSIKHRKNKEVYARFQKEAEILSSLNHPCIPVIYEINEFRNRPFITMEYLRGKSLLDLTEYKILSLAKILSISLEVVSGLKVAHSLGIIHRDLKLSNIMLDESGRVKIIDFGLAATGWLTPEEEQGVVIGTIPYMSPEQTRGEQLDHRSDIFSFGICLYELLSGHLPFFDPDANEVLRRVQQENPRPIREHRPDTPEILETSIFRCIEKEPEKRYQSIEELADVLKTVETHLAERGENGGSSGAARDRMEVMSLDIIAREKEYSRLSQAYFRSISGRGTVVFIEGEAGIGKTRLIEELTKHCDVARVHVASGQAHPGMVLPYRPLAEAIRYLMLAFDVVTDREIAAYIDDEYGRVSMQGRILKSFLIHQPSNHIEMAGKENLFDMVADLLAGFARRTPLVLVLENMHWADKATLDLLFHLTGCIQGRKILLIASYRPHEPGLQSKFPLNDLSTLVDEKGKSGDAIRLTLKRLSEEETQSLVRYYMPGNLYSKEFYHRIFNESDGNPLFVLELLKLFTRLGLLARTENGWVEKKQEKEMPVPTRIHDLISRRLSFLGEKELQVLEAAAVEGVSFSSDSVSYLTQTDRLTVLNMLRALWGQQLIHLKGESYRFNPSIVREVIYRNMMPELKKEYHRLLAYYYIESPPRGKDSPADVALHFHRAGLPEKATDYYMQAGYNALNLYADREALACFDRALALLEKTPLGPGVRTALDIHLQRAEILIRMGELEQSKDAANEAMALAKAMTLAEETGQSFKIKGKIAHLSGDSDTAVTLLEKGLELCKAPSEHAEILNYLGLIAENRGDHKQAMQRFSESLNISKRAKDRYKTAQTLNNIGRTLLNKGDPSAALIRFKNALQITEEISDRRGMAVNTNNLGILLRRMDRLWDALKLFFRSARIFNQIRYPDGAANTYWNIGTVFRAMGDRKKAEKFVRKANRIFTRIGSDHGITLCELSLGNLLAAAGEVDPALERFSASLNLGRRISYPRIVAYGLLSRGSLELSLGLIAEATKSLKAARDEAGGGEDLILSSIILSQLGLAHSLNHSQMKGYFHIKSAIVTAEKSRDPSVLGDAYFHLSRIELMGNQIAEAEKSFYRASTYIGRNARSERKAELNFASGLLEYHRNRPLQASRKFQTAYAFHQKLNQPLKMLECLHGIIAACEQLNQHETLERAEAARNDLIQRLLPSISSLDRQTTFTAFHRQGGGLIFLQPMK
ncbi:MAG: tetratricopeptide repeat protein [Planctomycetota bacterium]